MTTAETLNRSREEIVNCLTHGLGLVLSLIGTFVLIDMAAYSGEFPHVFSCSVYAGSLLFVYLTSTLYHYSLRPKWKHVLRVLDHIGIFLLIAGTYTPFSLVLMQGSWGWLLFGSIWGCALIGITGKIFSSRRFSNSYTTFYLLMGWVAAIFIVPMLRTIPMGALIYLALGGVCYTGGVVFYVWERLRYSHAIWHLFVLAGSIFHYLAILFYVLPMVESSPV